MTSPPTERSGGTFTFYDATDTVSFDPLLASSNSAPSDGLEFNALYDTLVAIDEAGDVVPRLATSVKGDATVTNWTITLRDGLTFSDGTALDAEAVVFNWDRHRDPANGSRCAAQMATWDSYRAVDTTTIEVALSAPNSRFATGLSQCLGLIASPTAIQAKGEAYGREPVGAGPFVLESWTPGVEQRFTRNPNYWDPGRPLSDELVILHADDNQQRLDAFVSGQADAMYTSQASTALTALRDDSQYEFVASPQVGGTGFYFNMTTAPGNDPRVREALALAIDLEDANEKAADGQAVSFTSLFPAEGPWGGNSDTEMRTGDLAAAQELIDDVVAETGAIDFTLTVPPTMKTWGEVIQQQWGRLEAVNVGFEVIEGGEMLRRMLAKEIEVSVWTVAGTDPDVLYENFHTSAPRNVSGYSNPEVDAALEAGRATTGLDKRRTAYATAAEHLLTDLPMIFVFQSEYYLVSHADDGTILVHPSGVADPAGM